MSWFVQLIKQAFPGSYEFFLLGVAVCVALSFRSASQRFGRRALIALTAIYWFLSLPIGAEILALGLASEFQRWHPNPDTPVQAIVILDAGTMRVRSEGQEFEQVNYSGALRVVEALRIDKKLKAKPLFIVASGSYYPQTGTRPEGEAIRLALVREGIAADRVILDSTSQTTRESAVVVAKRIRGLNCVVLVTSATHMRRAVLSFRSQGVTPIPAPAFESSKASWWFPSWSSLHQSEQATYDYLGLGYYWLRGWTRPSGDVNAACGGAAPVG